MKTAAKKLKPTGTKIVQDKPGPTGRLANAISAVRELNADELNKLEVYLEKGRDNRPMRVESEQEKFDRLEQTACDVAYWARTITARKQEGDDERYDWLHENEKRFHPGTVEHFAEFINKPLTPETLLLVVGIALEVGVQVALDEAPWEAGIPEWWGEKILGAGALSAVR